MNFKFNENNIVKHVGNEYLGLKGKKLVVKDRFILYSTPTYRVHPIGEPWKSYMLFEKSLKKVRGKING